MTVNLAKMSSARNKTIKLMHDEELKLSSRLIKLDGKAPVSLIENRVINGDLLESIDLLPSSFVDLLIVDPPYNLTKAFNGLTFKGRSMDEYEQWLGLWLPRLLRILKKTASIYICGDWNSSAAIHRIAVKHLLVRNRITWEREKGRGAKRNWKNSAEDIWYCTRSSEYTFNVNDVKVKRKVIAPYQHTDGTPKDWEKTRNGSYRETHPSNLWTDLTVPFWSMAENTEHPTQKPEKLLAKLILASSNEGDFVFDPFLGSGTTCVVAKKLNRRFSGIEIDRNYCCLAEKRLEMADGNVAIQGFVDGCFWERNSSPLSAGRLAENQQLQLVLK